MPIYKNSDYVSIVRPLPNDWPKDHFGIPFIKKEPLEISRMNTNLFLFNPKNISLKDKNANIKIIHSFNYDSVLKSKYDHPFPFMHRASRYYGVCSPDCSMHDSMQVWQLIDAIGASRWFGAFLQSYGFKVYPTVGWVNADSYDICFSGLMDGSTFFISSLGVNNDECRIEFLNGLSELRKRFPDSKQVCVGSKIQGMPDDICIIPYNESFGSQNKKDVAYQEKLLNWDGTLNKEVL